MSRTPRANEKATLKTSNDAWRAPSSKTRNEIKEQSRPKTEILVRAQGIVRHWPVQTQSQPPHNPRADKINHIHKCLRDLSKVVEQFMKMRRNEST